MAPSNIQQSLLAGFGHHQAGRLAEAESAYRQVLASDPRNADALHMLGMIAWQMGQLQTAAQLISQAITVNPNAAAFYSNLGLVLTAQGRLREAVEAFQSAIRIEPGLPASHFNLGRTWELLRQPDAAENEYETAIRLKPDYADAYNNLGNVCKDSGDPGRAAELYRQAIAINPNDADYYCNLGSALGQLNQLDEAARHLRRAIAMKPDHADAHCSLGIVLKDQGRIDEAVASFRRAVQLKPSRADFHSDLLYTLQYDPGCDIQALLEEHRRYQQRHADPLKAEIKPPTNDRDPARRLRIGYVSADFYNHPVARMMLPLLRNHNPNSFEIFCYSNRRKADGMTRQLRELTDVWRDVALLGDAELAEQVRQDGIDVLLNLALHSSHNRLLCFARRPAPVQVIWLGYPGTTGLNCVDYRITDPFLDPEGLNDAVYSERSVRLPETYWCYEPGESSPEVGSAPVFNNGYVTFGCLNNPCKVSAATLATWGQVLRAVPGSRLLLHAREGSHRQRVLGALASHGVNPARTSFVGFASYVEYLRSHQQIDISLDPHPYTGGVTTCDALWMGVPVVSLAGRLAVHRGGVTLLNSVRLPQLVAQSTEQYVRIAVELAGNLASLTDLRAGLRQRMQSSPLMDAPRFARNMESAYRIMWHQWCGNVQPPQT